MSGDVMAGLRPQKRHRKVSELSEVRPRSPTEAVRTVGDSSLRASQKDMELVAEMSSECAKKAPENDPDLVNGRSGASADVSLAFTRARAQLCASPRLAGVHWRH